MLRAIPALQLLALLITLPLVPTPALAGPDPAVVQRLAARMGRKPVRLVHDLKRVQPLKKVTSYYELGRGAAPLTTARTKEDWSPFVEGPVPINVDLANGCTVSGRADSYLLPEFAGGRRSKLRQLAISRGDKRIELDVSAAPINLARSNFFNTDYKTVAWNGPTSRFEMLLLGHELGHSKDYRRFSEAERQAISDIYDKTNGGQRLTVAEKSVLVGFERRAWAEALTSYRAHRRQGVDYLADGAEGRRTPSSAVFSTIYSFLKSYYDVPVAD